MDSFIFYEMRLRADNGFVLGKRASRSVVDTTHVMHLSICLSRSITRKSVGNKRRRSSLNIIYPLGLLSIYTEQRGFGVTGAKYFHLLRPVARKRGYP
jgi:hypothetical protein